MKTMKTLKHLSSCLLFHVRDCIYSSIGTMRCQKSPCNPSLKRLALLNFLVESYIFWWCLMASHDTNNSWSSTQVCLAYICQLTVNEFVMDLNNSWNCGIVWTFRKLIDWRFHCTKMYFIWCSVVYNRSFNKILTTKHYFQGFGGWGHRKIIPTISTVLVFKPTVKIPQLRCIQFVHSLFSRVVPRAKLINLAIKNIIYCRWIRFRNLNTVVMLKNYLEPNKWKL